MLCNRPFAGVSAAARKAYGNRDSKPPFVSSGNRMERLGLNPIRSKQKIHRTKKNTAVSKHKRWLEGVSREKREKREQEEKEETEKQQKREEFYERQRKYRLKKLQVVDEESKLAEPQDEPSPKPASKKAKKSSKSPQSPKKPRWAMTKEAAKKAKEREEEEEFEKLLDFANGLDFEQFMDDLEVRAALKVMKERVYDLVAKEIEEEEAREAEGAEVEEKHADEDDEDASSCGVEGAAVEGMQMFHPRVDMRREKDDETGGWDSSVNVKRRAGDDDDAKSIASARSILSTASMRSIKQIHSAKSLARLAQSVSKEDDRVEED